MVFLSVPLFCCAVCNLKGLVSSKAMTLLLLLFLISDKIIASGYKIYIYSLGIPLQMSIVGPALTLEWQTLTFSSFLVGIRCDLKPWVSRLFAWNLCMRKRVDLFGMLYRQTGSFFITRYKPSCSVPNLMVIYDIYSVYFFGPIPNSHGTSTFFEQ